MIGVGQQLGGYTILHRIGQGGMGDVYLAQHRRVSRRAAVKVLLPELSQKATVLDRFFNEARATSLIKHPGIVEILDCDVLDDQAFIIMEYLEGESLGEYLNRTGSLGPDMPFLLGISASIASAVGAAHDTGIVHRDLKPDNVYLHLSSTSDPTVTVKILDFGIAKLAQQEGGTSQTKTGMLLGTPAYMSPEQCRGAGQVDLRSDIYSLGCILYELVCGAPPFVHEGGGDMIIAHVSEQPEPPIARAPAVPPALNALILRMLAKKPDQRPQTMEDVANELVACARSVGVAIDKPLRPRIAVERPPSVSQYSATQVAPGGIPRSQVTPFPNSGAVSAPMPLRPSTPVPVAAPPSRSASVAEARRTRPATGPNAVLEPDLAPVAAGGTRVMEAVRATTTMGSVASELGVKPATGAPPKRGKAMAIVGAVVLIGGAIAVVSMRGGSTGKPIVNGEPSAAAPAPEKIAPAAAAVPPPVAAVEPKAVVAVPEAPATVRIDIQGVPAHSTITVDGRVAVLPLQLPRGIQTHHVVLKPPSGPERTLDLDGRQDRLIELVFEKARAADGPGGRAGGSENGRRTSGTSHERSGASKKKSGVSDRDAITDI